MAYGTEEKVSYTNKLLRERETIQTGNAEVESTVESTIRALDYEMTHLGELVDTLRSRLSLVLRPEGIEKSNQANGVGPACSPLVVLLQDRCRQALSISGMVDEMLRTLDL